MPDRGWDTWDLKRVHAVLWPGSEDWPDADLWPEVRISPPSECLADDDALVSAADVKARGDAHITYWAWAEHTPFVKIGQTQYVPARVVTTTSDGEGIRRRVVVPGVLQQAENRAAGWTTGTPWAVRLLRVHIGDKLHEGSEHRKYAEARMPGREWFDLRRLERQRVDGLATPGAR